MVVTEWLESRQVFTLDRWGFCRKSGGAGFVLLRPYSECGNLRGVPEATIELAGDSGIWQPAVESGRGDALLQEVEMGSHVARIALFVLVVLAAACDAPLTSPDAPNPRLAKNGPNKVTTLAEWQSAVTTATPGAEIIIQGVIEIPRGEEVYITAPDVTVLAATPGSGLRGVGNTEGQGPSCLICVADTGDGATVIGLTLDGVTGGPSEPVQLDPGVPMYTEARGVTFRNNHVVCDFPCAVHVWFEGAPDGTFQNNTLTGPPRFSAIQIQGPSPGVTVIDNWVEYAGPAGGIRIRTGSDNSVVRNNVIATSFGGGGINATDSRGGRFQDNKILAPDGPSCRDFTVGSGTAGTANTWIDNQSPAASVPAGICGP